MKRKNEIPDFSKKRKDVKPAHGVPDATKPLPQHPPAPPPVRASKPPATTMKSGRRGSWELVARGLQRATSLGV